MEETNEDSITTYPRRAGNRLCCASPCPRTKLDPEVRQQIEAVLTQFDEAYNKNDAAATAALFAQDAVRILSWESEGGLASGQQAIEKRYRATFAAPTPLDSKIIQMFPVGSDICAIMEYKIPTWKGHVITLFGRDADDWKIRMAYSN